MASNENLNPNTGSVTKAPSMTIPNDSTRSASHNNINELEAKETAEKFPTLGVGRSASVERPKSLTAAEMYQEVALEEDLTAAIERLKNEEPPLSYEEAQQAKRERSASIKKVRRDTITFIRNRTASRASATGQPVLLDAQKENTERGTRE
ncbi:hypothetical protein B0O99DRAFT_691744 [Bisporella sp. PMI_857]|nr:hypothetical protein B0O99DRAFT_691744 [Bisporella sp. PMI_857]